MSTIELGNQHLTIIYISIVEYALGDLLGSGATSQVFEGKRRSNQLNVVVKLIFKELIPPDCLKRDRSVGIVPIEVFILRRLDHPNVGALSVVFFYR